MSFVWVMGPQRFGPITQLRT